MAEVIARLKMLLRAEEGQALAEYALIVGFIGLIGLIAVTALGQGILGSISQVVAGFGGS